MLENCDNFVEEVLDLCEGWPEDCLFDYIQGVKELEEAGKLPYNFCEIKRHD